MKNRRLFSLLSIAFTFVFILSLVNTVSVFAEEGTPPSPTEEPALPPSEEPVEETVPAMAEVLEELPPDTELVVLDETGEVLPLTSQEAANIIIAGDPQWCAAGYTPADDPVGGTYCTAKFTYFNGVGGLIEELTTLGGIDTGAGTIYVSWDYDVTTAGDTAGIVFDYGDIELTDLTFQGGWDFGSNSVIGTTTFSFSSGAGLDFYDWGGFGVPGYLTLKDIIIDGGYGLYIDDSDVDPETTADVTLYNVDVVNTDYGAHIGTEGDVSITKSNFDNTQLDSGLVVENGGDITLNTVTANNNADTGAFLDNSCGCATGNIFISSSNFDDNDPLDNNDGRGLIAHSNGDVIIANVSASGNPGGGAELDNSTGSGSLTITGTNVFNNNGYGLLPSVGLYAISFGDIEVTGVTATGNSLGAGGGAFIASSGGNVTIKNSVFSNNCVACFVGAGLFAGGSGDITLNGVTASGNGNDPVYGYSGPAEGWGAIVLNFGGNVFVKNSTFSNNCANSSCDSSGSVLSGVSGGGIYVIAPAGVVSLDHVTASGNGGTDGMGALIEISGGDVDITCSKFSNHSGYGIAVESAGNTVTLNGVTFSGNGTNIVLASGTLVENVFNCDSGKKKPAGPSLPLNIVNVTSGQSVELDCVQYRGTLLVLPNNDRVLYPCSLKEQGKVESLGQDNLPGALPDGDTFASAFSAHLFKGGDQQTKVDPFITIAFGIPEGADASDLAILFWDGEKWVEVKNAHVGEDGHFEAQVGVMGTYVLVTR
jgi:hypothetical protein